MKILKNIFVLVCITGLFACEDTSVLEINVEESNYITIHAELIGGEEFKGVRITKPLPFDQDYDIEEAKLTDIIAYIQIDGAQVIPLHHTAEGIYRPLYELIINPGSTYELYARVGPRKIYSITKVPEVPVVNKAVIQNDFSLTATVLSEPNVVYGATWVIIIDTMTIVADNFQEINEDNENYLLTVNTQVIPENLRQFSLSSTRFVKVYAFDRPYIDFFNTRENNQPLDDYFTQGGGPVAWNVYGENVIGMFIGVTPSPLVRPEVERN
ncbi:hypothetical protein ACFLTH_00800 [Bacteroidota bacterium]